MQYLRIKGHNSSYSIYLYISKHIYNSLNTFFYNNFEINRISCQVKLFFKIISRALALRTTNNLRIMAVKATFAFFPFALKER